MTKRSTTLLLLLVAGCHSAPLTEDAVGTVGSAKRKVASDTWAPEDLPRPKSLAKKRVAISEFTVEFVETRWLWPAAPPSSTSAPTPGRPRFSATGSA